MVPRVSPKTSSSVSFHRSTPSSTTVSLTGGPPLLVAVGALDRVHLAAELDLKFDFLYLLF